jgi:sec-independent protein translocase protein TatA
MLINTPDVPLTLAFLPGPWEWIIVLAIGLLLFGKRLPDVGRSLGRSIVEFKKGIKGIEDDIDEESSRPSQRPRLNEPQDNPFRPAGESDEKPRGRKKAAAPTGESDDE